MTTDPVPVPAVTTALSTSSPRPVTEAVLELYADGWAKEDIAAHLQLPFQFVCEQLERDHAERYEDKHEDARRMNIKLQEMDRVLMLKIRARGRAGDIKAMFKSLELQAKLRGLFAPTKTETKVTRTPQSVEDAKRVLFSLGVIEGQPRQLQEHPPTPESLSNDPPVRNDAR
jgi:hypothetical protein